MKNIVITLFLITFFATCNGQSNLVIETIDAKEFAEKLKTSINPQILDVRTPTEFAIEHIENASNINWNGDNFDATVQKLDKTKPVFIYCKVVGRSKLASEKLGTLGFTKIYDLKGGIMKWNASGFGKPSDKIIGMCPQEFGDLLKTDKKIIINFYAKWCEPCKIMEPYILKLQTEMKGKITIVRLDADENKTLLESLKIDGLPVILIYENAKEVWRNIGFLSEDEFKKHL
ncbi:MAG: thioredoxin fold domain-containing protein [Flavobacterium sp.]|nr:thioredoxin fold domain-containing protein [Flavobacterium sp.]